MRLGVWIMGLRVRGMIELEWRMIVCKNLIVCAIISMIARRGRTSRNCVMRDEVVMLLFRLFFLEIDGTYFILMNG